MWEQLLQPKQFVTYFFRDKINMIFDIALKTKQFVNKQRNYNHRCLSEGILTIFFFFFFLHSKCSHSKYSIWVKNHMHRDSSKSTPCILHHQTTMTVYSGTPCLLFLPCRGGKAASRSPTYQCNDWSKEPSHMWPYRFLEIDPTLNKLRQKDAALIRVL